MLLQALHANHAQTSQNWEVSKGDRNVLDFVLSSLQAARRQEQLHIRDAVRGQLRLPKAFANARSKDMPYAVPVRARPDVAAITTNIQQQGGTIAGRIAAARVLSDASKRSGRMPATYRMLHAAAEPYAAGARSYNRLLLPPRLLAAALGHARRAELPARHGTRILASGLAALFVDVHQATGSSTEFTPIIEEIGEAENLTVNTIFQLCTETSGGRIYRRPNLSEAEFADDVVTNLDVAMGGMIGLYGPTSLDNGASTSP